MSKDNSSIHDFDVSLICDYYSTIERQGPGNKEVTLKALSFVGNLDPVSHVADIGCGTGGQTMVLGQNVPGRVTGIDIFPAFIDKFNARAKELGIHNRVKGEIGSMDNLPFSEEELDLIWSEGAIYFMGFEEGLREWHRFLKPGGYAVVSEATWFTPERPAEIEEFWQDAYPGIDTLPNKLMQMQNAGYVPLASFILPESCWTEDFYKPQVKAHEDFLAKNAGNKTAEAFIENQRHEIRLYHKYKDFYGYAFYIGKKA